MQSFLEFLSKNFDVYTRRARLQPALIAVLPITFAAIACFPSDFLGLATIVTLSITCGGIALLAQIGRNLGKQKEPKLFASWGGKPTTRMLRHKDTDNKVILGLRHKKLQALIPDIQIPNLQEEQNDPQHADEIYEACTEFLIKKTRDPDISKKVPLIFEENCNYGFHRNLWGLKPIGITLSIFGFLTVGAFIVYNILIMKVAPSPLTIIGGIIDFFLLTIWIFIITPNWIKPIAESYAKRLLESCDQL